MWARVAYSVDFFLIMVVIIELATRREWGLACPLALAMALLTIGFLALIEPEEEV